MNTRKLTLGNNVTFFLDVTVGEVFTYSMSLGPHEIIDMAHGYGFIVEYCSPGSAEYKKHGSSTMRVVDRHKTGKDYICEDLESRDYHPDVVRNIMWGLDGTYLLDSDGNSHYDYQDNLRIALISRPEEVREYIKQKQSGCCGFHDEIRWVTYFDDDGKEVTEGALVGFNYGH